jgi:trigger factor
MASQFLLDEVARTTEIGVEQDELSQHLFRRAQQSGQNPDEFVKHMVEHNHIPEMVAEVVRGKALARIVEGATVTDRSGKIVDLKNLLPDGSLADPEAQSAEAAADTDPGTDAVAETSDETEAPVASSSEAPVESSVESSAETGADQSEDATRQ